MNIIYSLCWIAPNIDVLFARFASSFFHMRFIVFELNVPWQAGGWQLRDSSGMIWQAPEGRWGAWQCNGLSRRVTCGQQDVLFSNLTFCIDCTLIFLMSQWPHKGYYYFKARLDNRARCSTEVGTWQSVHCETRTKVIVSHFYGKLFGI